MNKLPQLSLLEESSHMSYYSLRQVNVGKFDCDQMDRVPG
jgi:hypothetical protein